jgi:hypothetical protein
MYHIYRAVCKLYNRDRINLSFVYKLGVARSIQHNHRDWSDQINIYLLAGFTGLVDDVKGLDVGLMTARAYSQWRDARIVRGARTASR